MSIARLGRIPDVPFHMPRIQLTFQAFSRLMLNLHGSRHGCLSSGWRLEGQFKGQLPCRIGFGFLLMLSLPVSSNLWGHQSRCMVPAPQHSRDAATSESKPVSLSKLC